MPIIFLWAVGFWACLVPAAVSAQTAAEFKQRLNPWPSGGMLAGTLRAPDGNIFFTVQAGISALGRLDDASDTVTLFTIAPNASVPVGALALDPAGNVYFSYGSTYNIRRLDPTTGLVRSWLTGSDLVRGIAVDSAGRVMYTEGFGNAVARINPATQLRTRWPIPTPTSFPNDIAAAGDLFYFTEEFGRKIGRLDPNTNMMTEWAVPNPLGLPYRLSVDGDGNVWFTERTGNRIGRLNPATNEITEYESPSAAGGPAGIIGRPTGTAFTEQFASKVARHRPGGGTTTTVVPSATPVTPEVMALVFFDTANSSSIFNVPPVLDTIPTVRTPEFTEAAVPSLSGSPGPFPRDLAGTSDPNTFAFITRSGQGQIGLVTIPPVNEPPSFDPLADQTVNEDSGAQTASLTGISPGPSDEFSQTVGLSASSTNPSLFSLLEVAPHSISGFPGSAVLSYVPAPDQNGTAVVTVTADDGQDVNHAFSRSLLVTVTPVNDPPVADAGPDQTVNATSPSGASVLLNGSGSFDVDGDPLTFAWTGPFGAAAGITPTVLLPIGMPVVTLTVTDPSGATGTDTVKVWVKGAAEQISDLASLVVSFNLKQGILNSLDSKLQNILAAIAAEKTGDKAAACNKIGAFINEVEAQSGKAITFEQADLLISAARRILAVLGCS